MDANTLGCIQAAADKVRSLINFREPKVGVVLGSGLGGFADVLKNPQRVSYDKIPGFARSQTRGHCGQFVTGDCRGAPILVMQGRVHYHEGHSVEQVALPVQTMIRLGCQTLIITNAAGGIRQDLEPGDLCLIADHLNPSGLSPIRGSCRGDFGPQFPDMTEAYSLLLRTLASEVAEGMSIVLKSGVYCWHLGPQYETPAEIRMYRSMGADLAGMSTVPEVIAARHMGVRVLGISCVTNKAAGMQERLDHAEVEATAERVKPIFIQLLAGIVAAILDKS